MTSPSFYAAYPIVSHYKKLLIDKKEEFNRFIERPDLTSFLSYMNGKFDIFSENYFEGKKDIDDFEEGLTEAENKVFHDLFRFFFNEMNRFRKIFNLYSELNHAMDNLRKKRELRNSPFSKHIKNAMNEKRERTVVYYESRVLQDFFNQMKSLLDELNSDSLSYQVVQYWTDLYNIKMIYELKGDYGYKFEEIRPLLINGSSNSVYQAIDNAEEDSIVFKHPFLKGSEEDSELYYSVFHRSFRDFCRKKMSGIPFRHSYFLCFFLLLKIDFEAYRQLFASIKLNLKSEDIGKMISII